MLCDMVEISILMPCRNAEQFVEQSVRSVLKQTFSDFELLVIDDSSEDETWNILQSQAAKDARLKLVRNTTRHGVAASLNIALELASGRFIARMDADDLMLRNRLKKQRNFLEKRPYLDGCGMSIIRFGSRIGFKSFPRTADSISARILFQSPFAHPTIMVRSSVFKVYRYNESLDAGQDYELWLRMTNQHSFANMWSPGIFYRHHENQVSSAFKELQNLKRNEIRNNFYLTHGLIQIRYERKRQAISSVWRLCLSLARNPPQGIRVKSILLLVETLRQSARVLLGQEKSPA